MKEKIMNFKHIGTMIKALRLGQVPVGTTARVVFEPPKKTTKRKGLVLFELIIVMSLLAILAAITVRGCNKPKAADHGEFVGLQTKALAETTPAPEPEPEAAPEPPKLNTYTLINGSTVDCETATESNCGVRLTGCSNKRNYYCLNNISYAEEDDD